MKKAIAALCLALLLCGCSRETPAETSTVSETSVPENMTETEDAKTVPVPALPMSQEMAMLEGFVVMQDGDVRHNALEWYAFLEACEAGKSAHVTVAQYTMADSGSDACFYNVTFDGSTYTAAADMDGKTVTQTASTLVKETGMCDDTMEPYDSYEAYLLGDTVLFRDLIAAPDFEGVTEIFLHAKEGEPPVKSYTAVEAVDPILQLLMTAEYLPAEPEDYVYGMKLLMTNREGKPLVIELDLNRGVYRYGMQCYAYGEVPDLFAALDIDGWPEAVQEEFRAFMK